MKLDYQIQRSTFTDVNFLGLVSALDSELDGTYGNEQTKFSIYNKLDENTRVVLVYFEAKVVGCGAFRPLADNIKVEIKRIYVIPAFRGQGIAKLILKELENWAKEEFYSIALLETGVKQPAAITSYQSFGYVIIDNYGPYKDSSYSICMQKKLI